MTDKAPDSAPFDIHVRWAPGDSIWIDTGGLDDWEAAAALAQALGLLSTDEDEEADTEGKE